MNGWEMLLKDGQERLEAQRLEAAAREADRVRRLEEERRMNWERFELQVVEALPADIVPFIQFDRGEAWEQPGEYVQGVGIGCPGLQPVWVLFKRSERGGRWNVQDYTVAGWRLDAPYMGDEMPSKWRVVSDRNSMYSGDDLGLALAMAAERAVEKERLEGEAASRNADDEQERRAVQQAEPVPVSPERVESNRLLEALDGDQVALALVDVFRAIQAERGAWWSQQG